MFMVTGRVRVVYIHRLLQVQSASPSDSWALVILLANFARII